MSSPPPPLAGPAPYGAAEAAAGGAPRAKPLRVPWTPDEHARFLTALAGHGRDWRRVAAAVGGRSLAQVGSGRERGGAGGGRVRPARARATLQKGWAGRPTHLAAAEGRARPARARNPGARAERSGRPPRRGRPPSVRL